MGLLEILGLKAKVDYKELKSNGALIVDVRSPGEFKQGHYSGSVNVPLDRINQKIGNIKKKKKPVIAVCQSGMRSGRAVAIMKQNGIEAYNAGSWAGLQSKLG